MATNDMHMGTTSEAGEAGEAGEGHAYVVIELDMRGSQDDADQAVEALLDAGVVQDWINEYEGEGGRVRVQHATSGRGAERDTNDAQPPAGWAVSDRPSLREWEAEVAGVHGDDLRGWPKWARLALCNALADIDPALLDTQDDVVRFLEKLSTLVEDVDPALSVLLMVLSELDDIQRCEEHVPDLEMWLAPRLPSELAQRVVRTLATVFRIWAYDHETPEVEPHEAAEAAGAGYLASRRSGVPCAIPVKRDEEGVWWSERPAKRERAPRGATIYPTEAGALDAAAKLPV